MKIILVFIAMLAVASASGCIPLPKDSNNQVCDPVPGSPANSPFGEPRGVIPGRVTWSHEPKATKWDGKTGFWWENDNVDIDIVRNMVKNSIAAITEAPTAADSWLSIFAKFNFDHGKGARGYEDGEKIAIKINLNQQIYHDDCYAGIESNAGSPQVLRSLLESLTEDAGVPQEAISIYDASRCFPDNMYDAPTGIHQYFPNITIVDNQGKTGRTKVQIDYDSYLQVDCPDCVHQMVAWNLTKLPTVATEASYLIELDAFRGHDMAGITASGKNWFGSIYTQDPDQTCGLAGHWCPAPVHRFANVSDNPMGSYNILPDLLGHDGLGGKVILFLADGLYGGPTEQLTDPVHFETLGDWWSSSFFTSMDPIALDSVIFDFLRNEPNVPCASVPGWCVDNYLHEGALANSPPSGTVYMPNGVDKLGSLGIHEHWNNAKDRKYVGIDFVKVEV